MPKGHKSREESSKKSKSTSRTVRTRSEKRNPTTVKHRESKRALRSTTNTTTTTHSCKTCKKIFASADSVNRHSRSCKSAKNRSLQELDSSEESESFSIESTSSSTSASSSSSSSGEESDDQVPEVKRRRGRPPKNKVVKPPPKNNDIKDSKRKKVTQPSSKKSTDKKNKKGSDNDNEKSTEIKSKVSKSSTKTNKTNKTASKNSAIGKERPLTCEKCKMTYRTESGFYNHITTCVVYSSTTSDEEAEYSEDNEEDSNSNNSKQPQRRAGYEENVVCSDDDVEQEDDISHSESSKRDMPSPKAQEHHVKSEEQQHHRRHSKDFSQSTGILGVDNKHGKLSTFEDSPSIKTKVSKKSSMVDCGVMASIPIQTIQEPPRQMNPFIASVERFFSHSTSSTTSSQSVESTSTPSSSHKSKIRTKTKTSSTSRHISSDRATTANHSTGTEHQRSSSTKMTSSVGSQSESESSRYHISQKIQPLHTSTSSSSANNKEATISHIHGKNATSLGYSHGSLYPTTIPPPSPLFTNDSHYRPNGQHQLHVQDKKIQQQQQQQNVPTIFSHLHHSQQVIEQQQLININSHLINSSSSSITNSAGVIGSRSSQFSPNVNQLVPQHSPLAYPGFRSESAFTPSLGFSVPSQQPNPFQPNLPQLPPLPPPPQPAKSQEPETITMQDASGQIVRIQVPSMNEQLHIQPSPLSSPISRHLHPNPSELHHLHQQQQQQHLNFSWQQHPQLHYTQQHDLEIQSMIFQQQQQQQMMSAQIKQHQLLEAQLKEQHLQHELQQHSLHQYLIKHSLSQQQQQQLMSSSTMLSPAMDGTQWFSITNQNNMTPQIPGLGLAGPPQQAFIHNNASSSSYVLLQNGLNFSPTPFHIPPPGMPGGALSSPRQQQQMAAQHNPLLNHSPAFYGDQLGTSFRQPKNNSFPSSHQDKLYTHGHHPPQQQCVRSSLASSTQKLPHEKKVGSAQSCPCSLCIQKASSRIVGTKTAVVTKIEDTTHKYITKNKMQQQFNTPVWNTTSVPQKRMKNEAESSPTIGKSNHHHHKEHHKKHSKSSSSSNMPFQKILQKILPVPPPILPTTSVPSSSISFPQEALTPTSVVSSSANVAVVRPLENPLQKLSAQISQLTPTHCPEVISSSISSSPTSIQKRLGVPFVSHSGAEKQLGSDSPSAIEKEKVHGNNNISTDNLYSNNNNEKSESGHPSQYQKAPGTLKPIKSKSGQTIKSELKSMTPSVKRRSSKAKKADMDKNQQGKSIKVTLKRKEGDESYSIRDIRASGPSETAGTMRSLKIKAKITNGDQTGVATDVVVIPVVHTVPIPLDSESNLTIVEDEHEVEEIKSSTEMTPTVETNTPVTTMSLENVVKEGVNDEKHDVQKEQQQQEASNVPEPLKNTHRAVIVYEVKTGESVLFRSSNVRAVWGHIFQTVQGQRVNQNLPPLSYPQQLVSLTGKKPDISSSQDFNMSTVTHQAVQFLLQHLPGPGTSKHKLSKSKKKQHLLESVTEDSPVSDPVNDVNCARALGFTGRKPFDMFGWLASKHRTLPTIDRCVDSGKVDYHPIAMRYRTLREKLPLLLGVFYSTIHGRGLFTRRDIPEGEIIIEYAGEVIRSVLCDFREKYYESKGYGCYMFKIDDEEVVDSTLRGNAARFINHSCDPNCKSKVVELIGKKRILIFSLRKILGGEELTYDYKFPREGKDKKIPCTCGTKRCRKFLN